MKHLKKLSAILLITYSAIQNYSMAGMPSGPYIAWINLHEASKPHITKSLKEFLKTQQNQNICNSYLPGWIVYTQRRPDGINNELTNKALNHQDMPSKQILIRALKAFRDDDIPEGLDGLVAYSEKPSPRIISLDVRGKTKTSKLRNNIKDEQELISAFCRSLPEVYRR